MAGIVQWIQTTPDNAYDLFDRAVHAGYEDQETDGSSLWVIRSRFEGDLLPGKLAVKHKSAYVAWGGKENSVQDIEVCCASSDQIQWVEASNGIIPRNAIVAGNTKDGEALYVGRAKQGGTLTPGKVQGSHGGMYMPYNGQEIKYTTYEVMCTRT